MLEQIKQWIKPPTFPDDKDKTQHAQILHVLLASSAVFLLLATAGIIFIFVQKIGASVLIFSLFVLTLISWILLQRGQLQAASRLFVFGLWVTSTIAILLTGRITTSFVSLHLAAIVVASILLGRRASISLTLLSIVFGLGITILEITGYPLKHYFPAPPLASWTIWVLAFIFVLTPLNPIVQNSTQVAKALRESEAHFRSIYSQSPIAIALYDAEGSLTDANPAYLNLFGVTNVDAVEGFKLFDDPNVPEDTKQQLLAGEAVHYQAAFDFELVEELNLYQTTKSGHCYLDCFITPLTTGKDAPGGFLVHVRDITERKQMETALIESQTKLSAIFNNSLDSILVVKAGIFIMVNPALLRLHRYEDPNELIGCSVLDLVAPESRDEITEYIRRRAGGQPTPTFYEAMVLRSDGTKFWVELSVSTYELDQEMYTLAIERDITERKRVEDALKHRADEFAVLYEIASEITGENDLPELLNAITSRIATLFDVSGGGMYLYDEKRDELQVVSSAHPVVPVGTILMGEGMAGHVAQSRQPMIVNNYSKWEYSASQYSAIPFTAVVEAPMLYRGKLIGVLAASEISDEAHQFT